MTDKTKNMLIGIIILVVLFGSYKLLVRKNDSAEPSLSVNNTAVIPDSNRFNTPPSSREASITLQRIKRIKIDTGVFSGDVFKSLIDFRTEILPEPIGKNNPFSSKN